MALLTCTDTCTAGVQLKFDLWHKHPTLLPFLYHLAGTGKTESVKALGNLFGQQVLVFNCDEVHKH